MHGYHGCMGPKDSPTRLPPHTSPAQGGGGRGCRPALALVPPKLLDHHRWGPFPPPLLPLAPPPAGLPLPPVQLHC